MTVHPDISIVIRTRNEERIIGKTLEMVFAQKVDLPFEVIVIDSGSTDRTLEIVRGFKVRLYEISPKQFTYGFALNYGADLALGRFVINLSHDCVPVRTSWMADLVAPLVTDPSIAATLGKQEPMEGVNPFEEQALITHFRPAENGNPRGVFSNANCAIRKEVLQRYPFDEKACFAEDYIWAQTLPSELEIKYCPTASVYHSHPLRMRYWMNRYYNNGLFVPYLKNVYGINWETESDGGANISLKRTLAELTSYGGECLNAWVFLLRKKYFKQIPLVPIFVFLRRHFYKKGVLDGKKIYQKPSVNSI